ncbi:MAG TPA: beta-propeller fold lactonase family protein [Psychromonas sp.]
MRYQTFVIGYGDEQANGRGIYRVTLESGTLQARLVYACAMKPGALLVLGKQLLMSCRDDHQVSAILTFIIQENGMLSLQDKHEIPYFISSFARTENQKQCLASSFYDGVDLLLTINGSIEISSVIAHKYRSRSTDLRQSTCHPHHIGMIGSAQQVFSVDMGTDLVSLYAIEKDQLNIIDELWLDCPLGSGPRIMRISADHQFAYLLNEIANSIAVYALHGTKQTEPHSVPRSFSLQEIQRLSTLTEESQISNSAAGFAITADGKFLLATNRGEESLVLFQIDRRSGSLTFCQRIQTARTPRDIYIFGHQVIVAAQSSNCLQLFEIDTANRQLLMLDEVQGVTAPVGFAQ